MFASISKSYQVDPNFQLHGHAKSLSQHLEWCIDPKSLIGLPLGDLGGL
jgi:hypothetical protein